MTTNTRSALGQLSHLSDQDLLAHIHLAAQAEHRATAHLVALLIELDGRRLYLGEGFPSLYRQTRDKLRRAQDLLRHAVPNGDPAVIFDRALTLLLTQLERSKTGATDRPRTTGPGPGPVVARPRHHATCPRQPSASSRSATADAVPSSGRMGDVRPRPFLNTTMWCHSPLGVRHRRKTSSCDAARTIGTKRTGTSARYTCHWSERRVLCTA